MERTMIMPTYLFPYLHIIPLTGYITTNRALIYEVGMDAINTNGEINIGTPRIYKTTQLVKMYKYLQNVYRWDLSLDVWEGALNG